MPFFFTMRKLHLFYDEKGFDNALDYGSCLLEVGQILLLEIQQLKRVLSLLG